MTASDDRRINLQVRYLRARKNHQACAHLYEALRDERTKQLRREIRMNYWRYLFAHLKSLFGTRSNA